jgi:hypothetical protein
MSRLNASIPVLFTSEKIFDVNGATSDVNGAEDVNEFELFLFGGRCVADKFDRLIPLPDKSPSLSRRKCHFEY